VIQLQAYHHAINCAFMKLAYGGDIGACRAYVDRALHHWATAPDTVWRRATEGEANRYLRNTVSAADAYRRAIAAPPKRGRRRPSISRLIARPT
jgi:hypothetical protein